MAIIRAIVLAAIAQVTLLALLVGYLFHHGNEMAMKYAAMAERSAESYTDQRAQGLYNEIQVQFYDERESLHAYIDRRIDLKLSQLENN